ncbi:MAG: ion transporter [Phycisphaerae bacterium]|nr:ion transporter [Phycisphaerae bacterium]
MAQETTTENEKSAKVQAVSEMALALLGFVWLVLLIVEFAYGLSPLLLGVLNLIWAIFIIDFTVRFFMAGNKLLYLKANWLTGVSLMIPALRIFRIAQSIRFFKAASTFRGIRFVRLVTSFRRSVRSLAATMSRRGAPYVFGITLIVVLAGGAGMYAFERNAPQQQGFTSYWDAVWWTAMIVTTLGSQHWPITVEGKILCLLLATYAITVLGYVAASLASYFIGKDVADGAAHEP